jgi:YD repeat-containing protein
MQQYKQISFILILLILTPIIVIATTQDLTYDSPTNQVNISYDALNRISTKNATGINITYSYDEQYQGTLTNITFSNSTYKYQYDDRLRVTNETKIIDGIKFEKIIYYDSMDRPVKIILTPGTAEDIYYNNQSKISKITGFVNNSSYNAFDNLINRTYANSKITELTYDSLNNRLVQIKTGTIQQLNYTYDSAGNIILINDTVNSRTQRMAYDFLDRLVNATINNDAYIYSYNAIGNILKIVRNGTNTTKYVYNSTPVHAPSQLIITNSSVSIYKESELYSNARNRTIQFFLVNDKNSTMNVSWIVNFINGIINSTVPFNITANETVLVLAQNNYTNAGDYKLNITTNTTNATDIQYLQIKFGIRVNSLAVNSMNVSKVNFSLQLYNDMNIMSQNVSWNCSNGISSNSSFAMNPKEYRNISFDYNYSSPGKTSLTCSANSTDGNDTKAVDFNIKGINIEDYNATFTNGNTRALQFKITNYYYPMTIGWTITSNGQTFNNQTTLGTNQSTLVLQNITYSTDGIKNISINISSGAIVDRFNETIYIKALKMEDFNRIKTNGTNWITSIFIKNYWPQNSSINWNISDPNVSNSIVTNLTQNESLLLLIENNYTTQGLKTPKITAFNSSSSDFYIDRFIVKMVEVLRNLILTENQNSTINEITIRNNIGQRLISWLYNTTQQSINSNQSIQLNTSEEAIILIETNYSSSGIQPINISINSSSFNDTARGIAIQ